MTAPVLIALPHGLNVSGVATWAARLASGLAARGRPAALLLHPVPQDQSPVDVDLHPKVRVLRPRALPRLGTPAALSASLPLYRDAVRSLACDFGGPVTVLPNLHGDCYGLAAALAMIDPELIRGVGWCHSDNAYDARVLAHYEPLLARLVAVSDHLESQLQKALPARTADIVNLSYGAELEAGGATARRLRRSSASAGAPLRLIYTGRLEHRQKRILALVHLSTALAAKGVPHTLTIAGDGPARPDLELQTASLPIRLLGPLPPAEIPALLRAHDLFILPSRYEGLSIAMLEAMAAGCIPVVARTASGALQAIERGSSGEIADVPPEAEEAAVGHALAEAIARAQARGLPAMSAAAQRTIADRFSLESHLDRAAALLDEAAASPPRTWPADRPCAFSASTGSTSGSVPPGGAETMAAALRQLAGRTIVIHGTGEHTRQLAHLFADSPAAIAAFTDDDPATHGRGLWGWRIIPPAEAAAAGADAVLISSWIHEEAIWSRRSIYEQQGLRVTRLYA